MAAGNGSQELPVGEYLAQAREALARLAPDNRQQFLDEILPPWVEALSNGLDPRMTVYAKAVKQAIADASVRDNRADLAASVSPAADQGQIPTRRGTLGLPAVMDIVVEGARRVRPGARGDLLQENLAPLVGILTGGVQGDTLTHVRAVVAAVDPGRISRQLRNNPVYNPPTTTRAPGIAPRYADTGSAVPASVRYNVVPAAAGAGVVAWKPTRGKSR